MLYQGLEMLSLVRIGVLVTEGERNFISQKGDVMQSQIRVLGVSCVVVLVCAVGMAHAQRLSIRESFAECPDRVVP